MIFKSFYVPAFFLGVAKPVSRVNTVMVKPILFCLSKEVLSAAVHTSASCLSENVGVKD